MQYRTYAFFQQEFATKNTITEKKDIAVAKDGIERIVDERWGQIVALSEDGHTFLADFAKKQVRFLADAALEE